MHGHFQFFLYLDRFRNIDLFHQGEYAVRVRIFSEKKHVLAQPLSYFASEHSRVSADKQGGISEEGSFFRCSSFYIRYREETHDIHEGAVFEVDLSLKKTNVFEGITVQFELLFCRPPKTTDKTKPLPTAGKIGPLQQVSTQTFRLVPSARGVHSFARVSFDDLHTCHISTIVHCSLIYFTMSRTIPLRIHHIAKPKGKGAKGQAASAPKDDDFVLVGMNGEVSPVPDESPLPQRPSRPKTAGPGGRKGEKKIDKDLRMSIDMLQRCASMTLGALNDLKGKVQQFASYSSSPTQMTQLLDIVRSPQGTSTVQLDATAVLHHLRLLPEGKFVDETMVTSLVGDLSRWASQIQTLWHAFLSATPSLTKGLVPALRNEMMEQMMRRWKSVYFSRLNQEPGIPFDSSAMLRQHSAIAHKIRKASNFREALLLPLEESTYLSLCHDQPIFFTTHSGAPPLEPATPYPAKKRGGRNRDASVHLIVFAHGFQGTQYDLRLVKNALAEYYPDAEFLMSSSNEADTYDRVQTLGENLAKEVVGHVAMTMMSVKKLSFVGHSLGGLIIRAALTSPHLEPFLSRCHTYCSFGSPHLGYMYHENSLFDSGMWLLKKLKNARCLHELGLTDTKDKSQSYLYTLSESPGLQYFKHVLLCGSPQDGYAPFWATRIEVCENALRDQKHGSVHLAMVSNILRPLDSSGSGVHRFEVLFNLHGRGLDNTIKRAAHIMFLENQQFIRQFVGLTKQYFE